MRGRLRLLVVVALVIVVAAVAVVLLMNPGTETPAETPEGNGETIARTAVPDPAASPEPSVTPIPMVDIVVAVQELPRGMTIPPNAVELRHWPEAAAPYDAITDVNDVLGKIARTDIFREQPILSRMLVEDLSNLANVGSDAAAVLPNNRVAVAVPMDRITSVAYAIQDGDRVDVIVSLLFVDIDEIFQSIEPNQITLYAPRDDGGIELLQGIEGRADTCQFGPCIVSPSEGQRPRLVTQRTIQNALVVHIGDFPHDGRLFGVATPMPTPTPDVPDDTGGSQRQATAIPPTPLPPRPDIITLGVPPQDAVVLTWIVEAKLPITFALRSASDLSLIPTEDVTLNYIMTNFSISLPELAPFGIEPAITSIRQLFAGNQITLRGGN